MPSAITGSIGFKVQTAKNTEATGTYNWIRATRASFNPDSPVDMLPAEIGGTLLPQGAFKGSYGGIGTLEFVPRGRYISDLLYGLTGGRQVTTDQGISTHVFPARRDAYTDHPWLSFHVILPIAGGNTGVKLIDAFPVNFVLTGAAGNLVTATCDLRSLDVANVSSPSGAGWTPGEGDGWESNGSVFLASAPSAGLNFGDLGTPKVNNVTITVNNQVPDRREETFIGSFKAHDISLLRRTITVEMTCLWENAVLWNKIHNGGSTTWSNVPYQPNTDLVIELRSISPISGTNYYTLGFHAAAKAVVWQMRPLDPRPDALMTMALQGTVVDTGGTNPDWFFQLVSDWAPA